MILKDMGQWGPMNVATLRRLRSSYCKAPVYILLQILLASIWTMFAVLTHLEFASKPDPDHNVGLPFLCTFEVRHMTRVHSYIIQCVNDDNSLMQVAVMMNIGLCSLVAVVKAVHVISTFCVRPLIRSKELGEVLTEQKVLASPEDVGSGFGFTDLYFVLTMTDSEGLRSVLKSQKE